MEKSRHGHFILSVLCSNETETQERQRDEPAVSGKRLFPDPKFEMKRGRVDRGVKVRFRSELQFPIFYHIFRIFIKKGKKKKKKKSIYIILAN